MTKHHDRRRRRVAEPVQVYLERSDRDRLERLAGRLGLTKSDVLRQGLSALERQLADPEAHPALRLIGLAESEAAPAPYDVAREHDRALAEDEAASWETGRGGPRGR
jgi:hypothetical protein